MCVLINGIEKYIDRSFITTEGGQIKILACAEDIILLVPEPENLQYWLKVLRNIMNYVIYKWTLKKYEEVVFRNEDRRSNIEKWSWEGNDIEVINEYYCVGISLTCRLGHAKHLQEKVNKDKLAANITCKCNLMSSNNIIQKTLKVVNNFIRTEHKLWSINVRRKTICPCSVTGINCSFTVTGYICSSF